MGAVVIEGGQGENPSAADLARAVEEDGRALPSCCFPTTRTSSPQRSRCDELVEA